MRPYHTVSLRSPVGPLNQGIECVCCFFPPGVIFAEADWDIVGFKHTWISVLTHHFSGKAANGEMGIGSTRIWAIMETKRDMNERKLSVCSKFDGTQFKTSLETHIVYDTLGQGKLNIIRGVTSFLDNEVWFKIPTDPSLKKSPKRFELA